MTLQVASSGRFDNSRAKTPSSSFITIWYWNNLILKSSILDSSGAARFVTCWSLPNSWMTSQLAKNMGLGLKVHTFLPVDSGCVSICSTPDRVCSCLNYCNLPPGNMAAILYIVLNEESDCAFTIRPKVLAAFADGTDFLDGRPSASNMIRMQAEMKGDTDLERDRVSISKINACCVHAIFQSSSNYYLKLGFSRPRTPNEPSKPKSLAATRACSYSRTLSRSAGQLSSAIQLLEVGSWLLFSGRFLFLLYFCWCWLFLVIVVCYLFLVSCFLFAVCCSLVGERWLLN